MGTSNVMLVIINKAFLVGLEGVICRSKTFLWFYPVASWNDLVFCVGVTKLLFWRFWPKKRTKFFCFWWRHQSKKRFPICSSIRQGVFEGSKLDRFVRRSSWKCFRSNI